MDEFVRLHAEGDVLPSDVLNAALLRYFQQDVETRLDFIEKARNESLVRIRRGEESSEDAGRDAENADVQAQSARPQRKPKKDAGG